MQTHGIRPIDLVIVNLYPFEETISREGTSFEEAIEQIDIGGPAMLRSAAKNHAAVGVLVDPDDYQALIEELQLQQGVLSDATRRRLAVKSFQHTARYDALIAEYLAGHCAPCLPQQLSLSFQKVSDLRYGENPHQAAAFYRETNPPMGSLAGARLVQGKALSYNNLADADAALECARAFDASPTCVIVKHANPCGVATGPDLRRAYERAYQTDPTSAFGGIIAVNQPLDPETAQCILDQQFVEVILAPVIPAETARVLAQKPNIRLLETGHVRLGAEQLRYDFKRIGGGLLLQEADQAVLLPQDLRVVTRRSPTEAERDDLLFAWKVAKFVKSNAIVFARDGQTLGIGAGQMSRVYSARIAIIKAQDGDLEVKGSVVASDAFFPFRDGVDSAAQAGVTALIQPGGSVRDEEVIEAADAHGLAMVFTGVRHFRH
jgi:phosphoribosylaminoimidazolecarboxamide formyltransferase/IMP cyclohydrolase